MTNSPTRTTTRSSATSRAATSRAGSTRATAARTTSHAGLSADDVVDAALALVEDEGSASLTMRRLASELDVSPTTIYWHVGNRDELVVALIERFGQRMGDSQVCGTTPAERITSAADNIWFAALVHRNVTSLANQVGATTLLHLPLEAALLGEIEAAGIHGTAARDAMGSILYTMAGFLVGAWRTEEKVPERLRRAALWDSLDSDRFGADTIAAMQDLGDPRRLFEASLEALVVSILERATPGTDR